MTTPRILITGASGLLGSYLVPAAVQTDVDAIFVGNSHAGEGERWRECDLTSVAETVRMLDQVQPATILHAAALTNVDLCEEKPQLADAVNRGTTQRLADWAAANDSRLVLVSTDSVFDGHRGNYSERDEPNPLNVYARSKLAAELAAATIKNHLVVRTNLFARSQRGTGLAEWIIRELGAGHEITGFSDVVFSPLYCADLAARLLELARGSHTGVLHLGAVDAVSKLDFARLVARAYGYNELLVRPGVLANVTMKAPRPANTSLDVSTATMLLERPLPTVEAAIGEMASDYRSA